MVHLAPRVAFPPYVGAQPDFRGTRVRHGEKLSDSIGVSFSIRFDSVISPVLILEG